MHKLSTPLFKLFAVVFLCLAVFEREDAVAQSEFPSGLRFTEDLVLPTLPPAVAVAFAPDNRVFIAVKDGIVRVAVNGTLLPQPFLDISSIVNRNTDRGLLGIALDPQFPSRPFVYLFFVYDPPGRTPDTAEPRVSRLVRVTADAAKNYNEAMPNSLNTMEILVGKNSTAENTALTMSGQPTLQSPAETASCMTGLSADGTPIEDCFPADGRSHSAGTLIFAADGSLYASYGDASNYDTRNRSAFRTQNLDSLAGKILRIDPNTGNGLPGNPFYDPAKPGSNRSRVWAYGFRNPFRMTLNPANGQAYFGDVGTSYWEEINVGKGANFGWPCYEGGIAAGGGLDGSNTTSLQQPNYKKQEITKPLCDALYAQGLSVVTPAGFAYAHRFDAEGKDIGASITGIAFYSGDVYPAPFKGSLFYSDYALRYIRYLTFDASGKPTMNNFVTETGGGGVVQLLTGPDSNLYGLYLDLVAKKSELRRFRYTGSDNIPPRVVLKATPTAGDIPLVVTFNTDGTTDPDGQSFTYSWNFGDETAGSTEPNPTHVYERVGTFIARVTVTETSAPFASTSSEITIRTGVTPPRAFIDTPLTGTTFKIGDTISFSGHAEFSAAATADVTYTWSILQRHNEHEHLVSEVGGPSGTFVAEEHADNIAYKLCLYASAGVGLEDQKCLDILPQIVEYTLASDPVGATVTYVDEGLEGIAPYIVKPIVGSGVTFVAAPVHAGKLFSRWSDGVTSAQRTFTTGGTPTTLTAIYVKGPKAPTFSLITGSRRACGSGAKRPCLIVRGQRINLKGQVAAAAIQGGVKIVTIVIEVLKDGVWQPSSRKTLKRASVAFTSTLAAGKFKKGVPYRISIETANADGIVLARSKFRYVTLR